MLREKKPYSRTRLEKLLEAYSGSEGSNGTDSSALREGGELAGGTELQREAFHMHPMWLLPPLPSSMDSLPVSGNSLHTYSPGSAID